MNNNNYVAIMAGGIGSRFWPMSRTEYPKQFLDILNTGKTLLQATYDRYASFIPNENIYIVTSEEYRCIVEKQLPQLPVKNIIGEPQRKNTAPCIAYISLKLQQLNPAANLIVAPSDHLIEDENQFEKDCLTALNFTEHNNALVTLGIKPTYANTGYGYIQYQNEPGENGIHPVIRFTEKPNIELATSFYNSGNYLWNAGIFIWKTKDIIDAFLVNMPEMIYSFSRRLSDFNTEREQQAILDIYQQCESVSIDYAIMERAKNIFVIPSDFKWSDLGTWNSAWENSNKDSGKNAVNGDNVMMIDSNGCIVQTNDKKLIVVGGMDDLIIVNTEHALLICKKEHEQQIKEYVNKVKHLKGEFYL